MTDTSTVCENRYRILSLSGGGLLGVVQAAVLERFEELGRKAYGPNYELANSFHLVGGTSTGAIIATAIALGCQAQKIVNFYLVDAPNVFRRRLGRLPLVHPRFCGKKLAEYFAQTTQARRLTRSDLLTDLAVVSRNVTRHQTVLFTTICDVDRQPFGVQIKNAPVDLAELLCASTATPTYFPAVKIRSLPEYGDEIWVDGGVSLFNDPVALLMECAIASDYAAASRPVQALSLGSGLRPLVRPSPSMFSQLAALSTLRAVIADSETFWHQYMTSELRQRDIGSSSFFYEKINIPLQGNNFRLSAVGQTTNQFQRSLNPADMYGKNELYDLACSYSRTHINEPLPIAR